MAVDFFDIFFDHDTEVTVTERNLPHWSQEGKLYFVTWRLADSLPREVLEQLEEDRTAWVRRHGSKPIREMEHRVKEEWYRLFHHRIQAWLDAGHGSCVLRHPEAQRIMADALRHFNGQRYQLGSFVVAGNHVHVLVLPNAGVTLSSVLHSWKSFTANAINKALGRTGRLWMDENFDRLIRNELHMDQVEGYIASHVRQGAYVERRELGSPASSR